jgi:hypothetical protein
MRLLRIVFTALLIMGLLNCKLGNKMENQISSVSFFYWKSDFSLNKNTKVWLDSFPVKKLYVRFFDVDFDAQKGPMPIATLKNLPQNLPFRVTPVVFITNETFLNIRKENDLQDLADKVAGNLALLAKNQRVSEWLIDCDWSGKTRTYYFKFLSKLQERAFQNKITLMATIRLDQYKNYKSTGVPPLEKGLLMVYNMGDLSKWETTNSILNEEDAEMYLNNPVPYPIPLTLGLPFYQWGVVFRDLKLYRLMNGLDPMELTDTVRFKQMGENRYEIIKSTFLNGAYLYQGDKIRLEKIDSTALLKMINLLKGWKIENENDEIVFFHLNDKIVNNSNQTFFKRFSQKVSVKYIK